MNLPKDSRDAIGDSSSENLSLEYEYSKSEGQRKSWPQSAKLDWAKKATEHRYRRWKAVWGEKLTIFKITANSNMLINTEGGAVDHGLALWRWCGVPWLPGSGIKGCTRNGDEDSPGEIYGSTTQKGRLIFLPGLPLNANTVTTGITPHHGKRNPIPLPFPAIKKGSQFLFGVINPQMEKLPDIKEILETMGLGAKTTSGFGWVKIENVTKEITEEAEKEAKAKTVTSEKAAEAKVISEKAREELARLPRLLQVTKGDYVEATNKLAEACEEEQKEFITHLLTLPNWGDKVGTNNKKGDKRREICREVAKKLGIHLS